MEDLRVLFFFYFIESFLMVFTGFKLFNIKLSLPKLLVIGPSYALSIWLVRSTYIILKQPLGSHTLILAAVFFILVVAVGKVNINIGLGITLISFSLMLIGGSLSILVVQLFSLTPSQILGNPWLHVFVGNTENVILVAALLANHYGKFSLVN